MSSNYDLKSCPFCGGSVRVQNESIANKHSWKVFCIEGCFCMPSAQNEYFTSKERAIESSNKRVAVR